MTTGAAVCRGRSLADEFGEDALIAAARSCLSAPSAEIKQVITERADAFAAGAPQHDDMTLVIAQVG